MALTKDYVYKGITIPAAYHRVSYFSGTKDRLNFIVSISAAADGEEIDSTNYSIPYTLESPNPIQQAYAYLKALPDYAGAVDVLEAGQTA